MKKLFAISSVLLLLAACAPTVTNDAADDDADDIMMEDTHEMMEEDNDHDEDDMMELSDTTVDMKGARVIHVDASDWEFSPMTITAKKGEKVVVEVSAVTGSHGVAFPDLGVNVKVPQGETVSFMLPTDTAGTYEGVCSVPCGKGHKDMHITAVISE